MKVYEYRWDAGGYGGGLMIVVAHDREEADKVAKGQSRHWHYECDLYQLAYTGVSDTAFVLVSEYYQE